MIRYLQSSTKGEITLLAFLELFSRSIMDLESISISIASKWRFKHWRSPSLWPYSSAAKLVVIPIFLAYPQTHSPSPFLMSPSLLAGHVLPVKEPSELSLNHPASSFSHLILLTTLFAFVLRSFTQCSYSMTSQKIS